MRMHHQHRDVNTPPPRVEGMRAPKSRAMAMVLVGAVQLWAKRPAHEGPPSSFALSDPS